MLIDWFTIFSQLVNFLILMALLKRFLYKPILKALDDREKKIAGQLEDAAKIKTDAESERKEYACKNEQLEQQKAERLKQAQQVANVEREKLIEAARTESAALRASWHQALTIEQEGLQQDIIRQTRKEVFAMTRKTLSDLASESLEQRICEVFIQRLYTLNEAEKNQLNLAIKASSSPILVRSAFELPTSQQTAVRQAVNKVFAINATIEFQQHNDLISGIELMTNGHKLNWNINDYLTSLEHNINQLLVTKTLSHTDSASDGYAPN